jgi:hypothetical protein
MCDALPHNFHPLLFPFDGACLFHLIYLLCGCSSKNKFAPHHTVGRVEKEACEKEAVAENEQEE